MFPLLGCSRIIPSLFIDSRHFYNLEILNLLAIYTIFDSYLDNFPFEKGLSKLKFHIFLNN